MKFLVKLVIYLGLLLGAAYLVLYLFFPGILNDVFNVGSDENTEELHEVSSEEIRIGYSFIPENFEPTTASPVTKTYLLNSYESLVKFDRNLHVIPGLAVSWGRIDDTTWEFKLRDGVKFHDNSEFDSEDVEVSFERAMENRVSDLRDNLSSISSIESYNHSILIKTKYPDPLLLQRIASVLIFPSDFKSFDEPLGTGPYKFVSFDNKEFKLERFESYWGEKPYYQFGVFDYIPDTFDRLDAIQAGDVHILANVPPTSIEKLEKDQRVTLMSLPSLEVNFILINTENENLSDIRLRKALQLTFDKASFIENANGFASESYQFVSNGIFGFNPAIEESTYDLKECQDLVKQCSPFERITLELFMREGLERIGAFLKKSLDKSGVFVNISYLSLEDLTKAIGDGKGDLYYFGWRSELGDAQDFYEHVVSSDGDLNPGYKNSKVDSLINDLSENFDQEKRLIQLQNVMKIITEDDVIGVPLFESDVIYGVRIGVSFKPRLDGLILISEIK